MDDIPQIVEVTPAMVAMFGRAWAERVMGDPRVIDFVDDNQPEIFIYARPGWQVAALYAIGASIGWNKINRQAFFSTWSVSNKRDAALTTSAAVLMSLYAQSSGDGVKRLDKPVGHYLGPATRHKIVDLFIRPQLRDGRFSLDEACELDEGFRQIEQSPPVFDVFISELEDDAVINRHRHAARLVALWKDLSFLGVVEEAQQLQISTKAVKKTRAFIWERARALMDAT
jgi:hypothetical protein